MFRIMPDPIFPFKPHRSIGRLGLRSPIRVFPARRPDRSGVRALEDVPRVCRSPTGGARDA